MVAELVQSQVLTAREGTDLESLLGLEAKIRRAVRSSREESTLTAYRSDLKHFVAWCETHGLASVPAAPATVAGYISDIAEPSDGSRGLAASTIERRKAAIGEAHTLTGHPNPCADALVKQASKGVRRRIGTAQTRKAALSTADIRAMLTQMDLTRTIHVRDRAVLLFGFATAMRRSELVALNIADVEPHPDGLVVWKRRSKTDQEGKGLRIEVAYGQHPLTCPVTAYRTWTDTAGIDSGPVFRPVTRHGRIEPRAMSSRAVADVVKKHAARIGLDPTTVAGHSLRRGFATTAARNNANERTIARTTHHTSTKGLEPYIDDADLFTDPPSAYLGL